MKKMKNKETQRATHWTNLLLRQIEHFLPHHLLWSAPKFLTSRAWIMSMSSSPSYLLSLLQDQFFFFNLRIIFDRINENDLFKHDWRKRSKTQVLQYIFLKWTFACLVGLFTGLIATLINLAVENIAGYKLLAVGHFLAQER